ncbi:MAG: OsmC family protein [Thermoleophilia bacterium]|jgi:organic hydroperoxide reductase OsmC/OhrA|nr:OsmC family protein [Thermoleophilia bacterium]
MAVTARRLEFDATATSDGVVTGAEGTGPIQTGPGLTPEHLIMAAVARCTLASLEYAATRAQVVSAGSARAHGVVTRREDDGAFAFVEVVVDLDVTLDPDPGPEAVAGLLARAERGCFAGQSLRAKPRYRWRVNGREAAPAT